MQKSIPMSSNSTPYGLAKRHPLSQLRTEMVWKGNGNRREWQKVDQIRILMGDEISRRTKNAFNAGLEQVRQRLDLSLEAEKEKNGFLTGVPGIVEAIRSGKIVCRVCRKDKFHAKTYITHARVDVVGSSALVGSA